MRAYPTPHSSRHTDSPHPTRRRSRTPWWATLAAVCLIAGVPSVAGETVPAAVNYQGKLTDNLGNPVKSGYYEIQFRIWNDPTKTDNANYIWGRKFPLHVVTNGMFNVLLTNDGEVPGSPSVSSILDAFAGPDRYLGLTITRNPDITITTPVEITPRQKLATAPFAVHAHQATSADHAAAADNATQAASASSALKADNATKFDGMSTSDFVKVKQTSQTITGQLTVTGTLTGSSGLSLSGDAKVTGALTAGSLDVTGSESVGKGLTVKGDLTAEGAINAKNTVKITGSSVLVGGEAPFTIRRFHLPDISKDNHGPFWHDTKWSTANYSAVFVGLDCFGDFLEGGEGDLLQMMLYPNGNGADGSGSTSWRIYFGVRHADHVLKEIYVDVMFIRKELTSDDRATAVHELNASAN